MSADTFLVGAAKASTTSLFDALAQHPDVFAPPVKEPHFLTGVERVTVRQAKAREAAGDLPTGSRQLPVYPVTSRAAYEKLYRGAEAGQRRLDGSTSLLWHPEGPARVLAEAPDARAIAVLRDPVDRAWSHYRMDVRRRRQLLGFHDALLADQAFADRRWGVARLYLELGHYDEQVARWQAALDGRLLVLTFPELTRDTKRTLERVARHLDLDPAGMPAELPRSNEGGVPRNRLAAAVTGSRLAKSAARFVPTRLRNRALGALSKAPADRRVR
ncbi:MAG: sulfotransferase family protein, partial [Thermoplasmatota archaeon]